MSSLSYIPPAEFHRLSQLNLPAVLHTSLFATYCRINTLYMIARAGSGHIGSSFSSLDIVSWLYLNELEPGTDVYYSSKGHDVPGFYSVLIGRNLLDPDLLHCLRRLGGLPGHPDVHTPHVAANTGSLGMGISKAKGMALARRLQGKPGRFYILTGDGELQEGQFWESLASAANLGLGEITVIIDHNKIQSDTWVAKVNDLGDLELKLTAFGWHVDRCDGHNLEALTAALAGFKEITDKPKILIADTIKGRGVSFMEHIALKPTDRLYRFHSGAPDDETYAKAAAELIASANEQLRQVGAAELRLESAERPPRPSLEGKQRLIPAYAKALVEQGERNPRLVALDADLALDTGLLPFEERFPDRFIECGIAEQDMVSQASGLALQGMLPAVHSFACFLSTRPNEQIYNNATEQTKILYVGSLAGLLPSGPGHSHQSVRDISALAAVPGLILAEPGNEQEVGLLLDYCLNHTPDSAYLRLVSIPCEINYELPADYRPELGKGVTLVEGDDAILIGYGPVLLPQAVKAATILRQQHNISLKVVNLPWLNRVDKNWLQQTVAGYPWLFTLDNHYLAGGQGEMLASHLAQLPTPHSSLLTQYAIRNTQYVPPRVHRFGVEEIPACGQNDEVLRAHRLDGDSLAEDIAQWMKA